MKTNLKSIKGISVYKKSSLQPWGVVSHVSVNTCSGRVEALFIDTLSLIPLQYAVDLKNIALFNQKAIFLNDNTIKDRKENFTEIRGNEQIFTHQGKSRFLRDFHFDTETGEISDVIISRSRLSKKNKIPINNIYLKDNTIYIE